MCKQPHVSVNEAACYRTREETLVGCADLLSVLEFTENKVDGGEGEFGTYENWCVPT